MNLQNNNSKLLPYISNNFKIRNLNRFFYEYALFKNINIDSYDISQKDLNLKLNMVYTDFFRQELLDTISIVDTKNYFVELNTYNLNGIKVKVTEQIFNLFKKNESLSGKITLEFDKIRNFFYISNFEKWSFNFSLDDYLASNLDFKFLLESLGYDESNLLFREKISLLSRLLPYVEKNINIIEITKPQVGKSFIYDELMTEDVIVKKLNDLTETNLFSSITSSGPNEAILKNFSILCIDEFHKGDLKNIIAGLQTFMENGKVSRGKKSYHSETSIIMFANFKKKNSYKKIFVNPKEFNPFKDISGIDEAFLQRINYINPSFGMRTLNEGMFIAKEKERVPVSLYQEFFSNLRGINIDFKKIFPDIKIFNGNTEANLRITTSILKTASGFLKLLFPKTLNNIIKNYPLLPEDHTYIHYCFYLAMEGSSFLSTLQNTSNTTPNLVIVFGNTINNIQLGDSTLYKYIIEYFLRFSLQVFNNIYPHRYIYMNLENGIPLLNKIPLDTIGIEENIQENSFYTDIFNQNFLNNNFLVIPQNYTNNFYSNDYQIWLNGYLLYNLIDFKSLYKNYLFGYNLIYPQYQMSQTQQFDTTYFGHMIFSYNTPINCPKCNNSINLFNNVPLMKIESSFSCPHCNQEIFNYDLFPKCFEDYKE